MRFDCIEMARASVGSSVYGGNRGNRSIVHYTFPAREMIEKIFKKYERIAQLLMTKFCKFHCVARKIDRDKTFPATQFNMGPYGVIAHY